MATKTTKVVLENLKTTLEMAEYGLKDLESDNPKFRDLGLRNLAIHGRSVTFVIQNLRNLEPDFEDWYTPIQDEMKSSELCRFFVELRNQIEKQGHVSRTNLMRINSLSSDIVNRFPRPKNADVIGFFIGDNLGGSGWEIKLPDGTKDKMYLDLPIEGIEIESHFSNPPKDHLGTSLEGKTIPEIGSIYFNYLNDITKLTIKKFKP